ncbi:hypothetical protein FE257_012644 [Aspergillus nanangensis]|uniref:ATP-dependent (S)-NAD(P)H-hydrate dehydratase n=1 Tax=Aspergillus nanangensis TaxID=2582783 RepID=A0AAD4CHB3_ASPNN|nr:hypothetical protein FE257_012644 [Aspergillus nanangensis]
METHHISTSSKTLFNKVRKIVPPLLERFHKGTSIAGNMDVLHYTGAPYFSSMASAKLGCDMSHVICERSASPVIKSYSPNLMVHPILPSSDSVKNPDSIDAPALAGPIIAMLSRLHALVIGPGLGRDSVTLKVVNEVMKEARSRSIPFILDADGLLLVAEDPNLVKGYKECILTPNVNEFGRLAKALGIDLPSPAPAQPTSGSSTDDNDNRQTEACRKLALALGGVTIIQKGAHDVISNGVASIISDIPGGLKRSGGQGDTLTGSLGTLLAWRAAYHNGLWDSGENDAPTTEAQSQQEVRAELETENRRMSPATTLLLVAWGGSAITRECSRRAFKAKGRSMQASDLTEEVHGSFLTLVGEPDGSKVHL